MYLIFVPVGLDQVLSSCFSGRIWVRGPHWTALIKHLQKTNNPISKSLTINSTYPPNNLSTKSLFADLVQTGSVDFISADVDKALWLVSGLMGGSQ